MEKTDSSTIGTVIDKAVMAENYVLGLDPKSQVILEFATGVLVSEMLYGGPLKSVVTLLAGFSTVYGVEKARGNELPVVAPDVVNGVCTGAKMAWNGISNLIENARANSTDSALHTDSTTNTFHDEA